jgi:hypothetical protein
MSLSLPGAMLGMGVRRTPAHCIIDGPLGNGTSEQGDVFCFDTSGNLLDTLYTTQWVVG